MELEKLLKTLPEGQQTVLDIAGSGPARTVELKVRKLLPEEPRAPKRSESPPRGHVFLSAESLAAYLQRYGSATTVVYADPQQELISVVLDEKSAVGFEIVTMAPQIHPLWKPWAELAGRPLKVSDFARFVAQNRRSIVVPEGRDLSLMLSQVRATVTVEIQTGRGKEAINGLVVSTLIKGEPHRTEVDLPDSITVRSPLYVQTDPKDIELDLCVEATPAGDVVVIVTAGSVAEARVAAFSEMVETIRRGIESLGATLTFGRPAHSSWDYLDESE